MDVCRIFSDIKLDIFQKMQFCNKRSEEWWRKPDEVFVLSKLQNPLFMDNIWQKEYWNKVFLIKCGRNIKLEMWQKYQYHLTFLKLPHSPTVFPRISLIFNLFYYYWIVKNLVLIQICWSFWIIVSYYQC